MKKLSPAIKKLIILLVTLLVAVGCVTWGLMSYFGLKSARFEGTITSVQLLSNKDTGGIQKAIIIARDENKAYTFEFNPNTKVYDTENKETTFHYVYMGHKIKVVYDKTQTAQEPAEYIAKVVNITEADQPGLQ